MLSNVNGSVSCADHTLIKQEASTKMKVKKLSLLAVEKYMGNKLLDLHRSNFASKQISCLSERINYISDKNKIINLVMPQFMMPDEITTVMCSEITDNINNQATIFQEYLQKSCDYFEYADFGEDIASYDIPRYATLWHPENIDSFDYWQDSNQRLDKAVPLDYICANRKYDPLKIDSDITVKQEAGESVPWYTDPKQIYLYKFGTVDHFPEEEECGKSITDFFVAGDNVYPLVIGISVKYTDMTPDWPYELSWIFKLDDYLNSGKYVSGDYCFISPIIKNWILNDQCPENELANCIGSKYWMPSAIPIDLTEINGAIPIPNRSR